MYKILLVKTLIYTKFCFYKINHKKTETTKSVKIKHEFQKKRHA